MNQPKVGFVIPVLYAKHIIQTETNGEGLVEIIRFKNVQLVIEDKKFVGTGLHRAHLVECLH